MNTNKVPRLMLWKETLAMGFNTSRGYIKEGVKPKDVKTYNEFMLELREAITELAQNNPTLNGDNVYVELYEGEDCDSEVVFTWLVPEDDNSYNRRVEEIQRLNAVKEMADRMELERRIKDNPELAKEIFDKLNENKE